MIIDTEKLMDAIDAAEEKTLNDRYGGDWEKCPMAFLTASETRVIQRKRIISDVENLTAQLLAYGVWPVK